MKLEFNRASNDIVNKKIIEVLKSFDNVIVFGAGDSGNWVTRLLEDNGIYPCCYCDNYALKWGKNKNGIMIEKFEDAMEKYPNAAICIASMWSEEIKKQIESYDAKLMSRTWDLLTTMAWETSCKEFYSSEPEYIRNNLASFEKIQNSLADDISKETLAGILNYRLTRDKSFIQNIKSNERIYIDSTVIPPGNWGQVFSKTMIDAGAFDGDTVDYFIDAIGAQRELDIHCYESNDKNCDIIDGKKEKWEPHRVHLHRSILWSEPDKHMCIGGGEGNLSGKVSENDNYSEQVNSEITATESIDSFGYENVGFIKMDIEGAEREALKGAENTIKRCRPVLAICAYHLQDDLIVLANFIESLKCDYRLFLRHYMSSSGDTIMYAVPKEL